MYLKLVFIYHEILFISLTKWSECWTQIINELRELWLEPA